MSRKTERITVHLPATVEAALEGVSNRSAYIAALIEGRGWAVQRAVEALQHYHRIDDAGRALLFAETGGGIAPVERGILDNVRLLAEEEVMGRKVSTDPKE